MNDQMDETIEALLRERFDGPVPDDGFCEAVLERLPEVRRHRIAWPSFAGCIAGLIACWIAIWSASLTSAAARDWLEGEASSASFTLLITTAGMAFLALALALTEASERVEPSRRQVTR